MNSDRAKWLLAPGLFMAVAGCAHNPLLEQPGDVAFGEPNRQTMMAQVINPDPYYEDAVPVSSAEHAVQAIDRYRNDSVKQPEGVRTTDVGEGSSSN